MTALVSVGRRTLAHSRAVALGNAVTQHGPQLGALAPPLQAVADAGLAWSRNPTNPALRAAVATAGAEAQSVADAADLLPWQRQLVTHAAVLVRTVLGEVQSC